AAPPPPRSLRRSGRQSVSSQVYYRQSWDDNFIMYFINVIDKSLNRTTLDDTYRMNRKRRKKESHREKTVSGQTPPLLAEGGTACASFSFHRLA
ncbi:hypothetical protein L249_8846, partial [Ophiocordyceps polyrhachis-furcata BCC 54312]